MQMMLYLIRTCYLTLAIITDAYSLQSFRCVKTNLFQVGLYPKSQSSKFLLFSTTSSSKGTDDIHDNIMIENNSINASEELSKRYPIGSQPEFAIPDDSTIESPMQRRLLWVHFGMLFYNIYLVVSSLDLSTFLPIDIAKYSFLILFSVVLGDFATGVFHWSVDNYGSIKTPVFGSVCAAFQGHHSTPWTITFRSFYNNLYKVAAGTIPALLLLSLSSCSTEIRLFFALFINWWLLSQEFHKWSHMRNPPNYARALQSAGLILSRKEHGLHHQDPFDTNYCILTGVCNPVLDKLRFFKGMEHLVLAITGNKPKNWKETVWANE